MDAYRKHEPIPFRLKPAEEDKWIEVYIAVAAAVAGAFNCSDTAAPSGWARAVADRFIKDLRERTGP